MSRPQGFDTGWAVWDRCLETLVTLGLRWPGRLGLLWILGLCTGLAAQGTPLLHRVLGRWGQAYDRGKIDLQQLAVDHGKVHPVYGKRWLSSKNLDITHRSALQTLLDHAANKPGIAVTRELLILSSKGLLDGTATLARPHFALRSLCRAGLNQHTGTANLMFLMQVAVGDYQGFARRPTDRIGLQAAAIMALGGMRKPVVRPTLQRQLAAEEELVRLAAAEALGEYGHTRSLPALAAALGKETSGVVALAEVSAIHASLVGEKSVVDTEVLRGVLMAAVGAIGKTDWRTDLEIVDLLFELRSAMAIEPLIKILHRFVGDRSRIRGSQRLRYATFDALRSLTGALLPIDRPDLWQKFWEDNRDTFVVAPRKDLEPSLTVAGFFGIPVKGSNVLFVIDTSGSMAFGFMPRGAYVPKAEDDKLTRMVMARRELLAAVKRLPPDARFNLVEFSADVRMWKPDLVRADARSKAELVNRARRIKPRGATNIFGALEAGLQIRSLAYGSRYGNSVDEVFLLSDGEPTAGKIIDTQRILDVIRETNRHSRVRINTLYMGAGGDSDFMRDLAAQNGGRYVRL